MKRLILIKTCRETQLAHLYEHIYLEAVSTFLRDRGFLNYLDYRWRGRSYGGGFIHVEIDLLAIEVQQLARALSRLEPSFYDEKMVDRAAAEIAAEKQRLYADNGTKRVQKALKSLHAQPWQTIDEFACHDRLHLRRSRDVFWLSASKAPTKVLRSDFLLDEGVTSQRRSILPLFTIIINALQDNLSHDLAKKYSFYMYTDTAHYTSKGAKESTKYRVVAEIKPELSEVMDTCKRALEDLIKANVISRISHFLVASNYFSAPLDAPNELGAYNTCGILVGAAGWRAIATEANIKEILRHTTLQLTLGRQKQSLRTTDLI